MLKLVLLIFALGLGGHLILPSLETDQFLLQVLLVQVHRFLNIEVLSQSLHQKDQPVITIIDFLLNAQDLLVKFSYFHKRDMITRDDNLLRLKF